MSRPSPVLTAVRRHVPRSVVAFAWNPPGPPYSRSPGNINCVGHGPQNSGNYNAQARIAFHPVQNCGQGRTALRRRSCCYNQKRLTGEDKHMIRYSQRGSRPAAARDRRPRGPYSLLASPQRKPIGFATMQPGTLNHTSASAVAKVLKEKGRPERRRAADRRRIRSHSAGQPRRSRVRHREYLRSRSAQKRPTPICG